MRPDSILMPAHFLCHFLNMFSCGADCVAVLAWCIFSKPMPLGKGLKKDKKKLWKIPYKVLTPPPSPLHEKNFNV